MKRIVLSAILALTASAAFASSVADASAGRETAPVPRMITKEQFDAQKQQVVQALDKQLRTLRASRNCVSAATQPAQVRDCMSSLRIAPPADGKRAHGPGAQSRS